MSESTEFQPLDPEYADDIFTELAELEVQLDPDPLPFGLKRINGKIALCRKHLARTERIFLDVAQRLSRYKRQLRVATLMLDLEKKNLLANDPEVRAGRAVSEREALASGKLTDEVQAVANTTHATEDLEAVFAVVKAKRSDLRDTQSRLRDQIRVCQDEISLGARWGSRCLTRPTEMEPGQGYADGADVAEVDELIQNVRAVADAEMHLLSEDDDSDPEDEQDADLTVAAPEVEDVAEPKGGLNLDVGLGDEINFSYTNTEPEPKAVPEPEPEAVPEPEPEAVPKVTEPEPVPPWVDQQESPAAEIIEGKDLVDEFGFVPHCAECGEPQFRSLSGMTCPNGHGGSDSVVASDELDAPAVAPTGDSVLPGTSSEEDVADFLLLDDEVEKPLSGREIEEADSALDIDSILMNFKSF